jgi:hypothetical protein
VQVSQEFAADAAVAVASLSSRSAVAASLPDFHGSEQNDNRFSTSPGVPKALERFVRWSRFFDMKLRKFRYIYIGNLNLENSW